MDLRRNWMFSETATQGRATIASFYNWILTTNLGN